MYRILTMAAMRLSLYGYTLLLYNIKHTNTIFIRPLTHVSFSLLYPRKYNDVSMVTAMRLCAKGADKMVRYGKNISSVT